MVPADNDHVLEAAPTARAGTHSTAVTPQRPDHLARLFPSLVALTLLATVMQAVAAAMLDEPAPAASAVSTGVFAIVVRISARQIRRGHALRARISIAVILTLFAASGAYVIPGVAGSVALLPIVSVALVLPYLRRARIVPVIAAALVSIVAIIVLGDLPKQLPPISGVAGVVYENGIVVGVALLALASLVDFAMDARDSLGRLRSTVDGHLQATAERLGFLRVLHTLRPQPTSAATAALIANALSDLPLVDVALVLEATDDGLTVLAAAGHEMHPIGVDDRMPPERAEYLLERSGEGAWAQLWADRPGPGLEDQQLTDLGIKGQAFAPILADHEIVGLISIATTDPDQAGYLIADVPSVTEAAAVAGAILGPALLARRDERTARVRIAEAIASAAFSSVFQPIVELQTGLTVGYEALTRFGSGDAPDRMFADAARAGLGYELETATLATALRDAVRLPSHAWLSLNVSPSLLGECAALEKLLASRTRSIVLEITEHDLIDDYALLHAAMRRLGPDVRLAVDDAGAGVANFGHLVELRPDIVKVDAGLVRGVNADVSRQALVVGLVHFAAVANAQVVAEGIETEAEHATLMRLGVTLGQGYYLAQPAAVDHWPELTGGPGTGVANGRVIPMRRREAS